MASIADSLAPEVLEQLGQAFRLELEDLEAVASGYRNLEDHIEDMMGFVTSSHLWDAMWRFGIVLDDDAAKVYNLGNYWRPDGSLEQGYYVPSDFDTTYQLIELSGPNRAEGI